MKKDYFNIELKYQQLTSDLARLYTIALDTAETIDDNYNISKAFEDIKDALEYAKLYEISKAKKSEGSKKAWAKLTKKERRERATKASHARKSVQSRSI